MKTFDSTTCTWSEYLESFNAWLNERVDTKLSVSHKINGAGYITAIKATDDSVYVTIDFLGMSKQYSLLFLIEHGHLTLNETTHEILQEIYTVYTASLVTRDIELKAEISAKREADRLEQEALKKEAAEKARRERAIKNIQDTKPKAILSEPKTYYETLGWMAGNVKSIKAAVPSDLESWFVKNFGAVEHTVIDSSKKTINGHPMKWSISFKATFKNEVPALIADKTGVSKKSIDSVAYIWDLIENHGFCFGTKQDVDHIRKFVPNSFLSEFETGLVSCEA